MGLSDNKKKSKSGRTRTKYTPEQLEILEDEFSQSQYPDTDTLERLSDKLHLSMEKVSVWFQNRRSKFKRNSKESQVSWMRKQFYTTDHVLQKKETRHVLSPSISSCTTDFTVKKPSTNLHYLPTTTSFIQPLSENKSSATSPPVTSSNNADTAICEQSHDTTFLSHFLNDSAAIFMPYSSLPYLQPCQYFANNISSLHSASQVPFDSW